VLSVNAKRRMSTPSGGQTRIAEPPGITTFNAGSTQASGSILPFRCCQEEISVQTTNVRTSFLRTPEVEMLFPEALHWESLPFESRRHNTTKCRASYVTYSLKLTEFLGID
jgi:hypothetical protein